MKKDPICLMDVNEAVAEKKGLTSLNSGEKYYFCSAGCKNKFDKKEVWYRSEKFGKIFPWILGAVLLGGAVWSYYADFMLVYMGVFFMVFSLMKMPDWRGFVEAFGKYDLIAKNLKFYGWIYPALEFVLGILYLSGSYVYIASWITIFVMGIGAIGVGKNIFSKNQFQCACLGTSINVPLTKVTLLEDVIMVFMAISLII